MANLYGQSIKIAHANQALSGAYLASPNFSAYRYSWFRDGAFIAYSMDLAGHHESAQQFHDWASNTILCHKEKALRGILKAQQGRNPQQGECLHARYTVDRKEAGQGWGNFQLDGLGSWLWALAQHVHLTRKKNLKWEEAAQLVMRYLVALWQQPCYDCWEEYGDRIHISTLAAIYGGIKAATDIYPCKEAIPVCEEIRQFVFKNGVRSGHLIKYVGSHAVDSSLLGVSTPYRLLRPNDRVMKMTVAKIQRDLQGESGGLHRYLGDTYYGGGEWILLTAWLGWYYVEIGELEQARRRLSWVENQVDRGELPEQVATDLLAPEHYEEWTERWGPVARPLLWSHAMYLILYHAMEG